MFKIIGVQHLKYWIAVEKSRVWAYLNWCVLFYHRESASNTANTSATSTASSDMVVEGGSKDGLSNNEDSLPVEFDDSPLLFPE